MLKLHKLRLLKFIGNHLVGVVNWLGEPCFIRNWFVIGLIAGLIAIQQIFFARN